MITVSIIRLVRLPPERRIHAAPSPESSSEG